MAGFYILAGFNHFINPDFYLPLIPDYLGYPSTINIASGVIEIILGIGVLFEGTRKASSILVIAMLIAFIPAHIYFMQSGNCIEGGLCVSAWISWVRLLIIHPLLMYWAWSVSRITSRKAAT